MQGKNPNFIQKLVDKVNESITSLGTLEQGFSEVVLIYVSLQKLDSPSKIWFKGNVKKMNCQK